MSYRLYVGNLPYETDDRALAAIFQPYGRVLSSHVIVDRESGKSRGFGFIEMADEQELATARAALDGQLHAGHRLNLLEARERAEPEPPADREAPPERPTLSLARRLGQRTRR
jgi:RNA recognition motif-containing protein